MADSLAGERSIVQSGREIKMWVGMDYPGGAISVNSCYVSNGRGGKKLRPEAWRWRQTLADSFGWLLKAHRIGELYPDGFARNVTVQIDGHYTDQNHMTDVDNLQKLTWDAVKVAIGVDDRFFQPNEGVVTFGNAIPFIIVTVRATLVAPKEPPAPGDAGGKPGKKRGDRTATGRKRAPTRDHTTPTPAV